MFRTRHPTRVGCNWRVPNTRCHTMELIPSSQSLICRISAESATFEVAGTGNWHGRSNLQPVSTGRLAPATHRRGEVGHSRGLHRRVPVDPMTSMPSSHAYQRIVIVDTQSLERLRSLVEYRAQLVANIRCDGPKQARVSAEHSVLHATRVDLGNHSEFFARRRGGPTIKTVHDNADRAFRS